jgi:hypothetical protein
MIGGAGAVAADPCRPAANTLVGKSEDRQLTHDWLVTFLQARKGWREDV